MSGVDDYANCPLCGKVMVEEPGWKGLFVCPDGKIVLNPNEGPPFKFKCNGKHFTDEAVEEFDRACMRIFAERN